MMSETAFFVKDVDRPEGLRLHRRGSSEGRGTAPPTSTAHTKTELPARPPRRARRRTTSSRGRTSSSTPRTSRITRTSATASRPSSDARSATTSTSPTTWRTPSTACASSSPPTRACPHGGGRSTCSGAHASLHGPSPRTTRGTPRPRPPSTGCSAASRRPRLRGVLLLYALASTALGLALAPALWCVRAHRGLEQPAPGPLRWLGVGTAGRPVLLRLRLRAAGRRPGLQLDPAHSGAPVQGRVLHAPRRCRGSCTTGSSTWFATPSCPSSP